MISRIMKNSDAIVISICIITLSVIGKFFTDFGLTWYKTLALPKITPPNWVFAVVWTALYLLGACAVLILVRGYKHTPMYRRILGFFCIVGLLNPLWSYLFFVHQSIAGALLDAIVMEFTLIIIMVYTWVDARIVALLITPAALWIAFAIYLNYHILFLN